MKPWVHEQEKLFWKIFFAVTFSFLKTGFLTREISSDLAVYGTYRLCASGDKDSAIM